MDWRKLVALTMLLTMIASAYATITVTVNSPSGELFLPNRGDRDININFIVTDDNSDQGLHRAIIQWNHPDGNRFIMNDTNLSTDNCEFPTALDWSDTVSCTTTLTIPRGSEQIVTKEYMIDFNVTGYGTVEHHAEGFAAVEFNLDYRFIDVATENVLLIIPIILIAAMLIGVVMFFTGNIDSKVMLMITMGAVIAVIAVVVVSIFLEILTP